jgi:cell division protein FtsQ
MFRKLAKILGALVLIIFLIGSLAFTSYEKKEVKCTAIEVSFNNSDPIHVSKNEVLRLVNAADKQIIKKSLNQINSEIIEASVEKNQAIKEAQVYKIIKNDSGTYNGVLVIKVLHREPVLRVITESASYYLDKEGNKIPASSNFATNVLVATGAISEKLAVEKILPFVLFVEDDDFWHAQIEQINVERGGDIHLIPLIGDQIIEMGSLDNYERKLRRVKSFYEQVIAKNNWDKYKEISVKYDNQVIAKRK